MKTTIAYSSLAAIMALGALPAAAFAQDNGVAAEVDAAAADLGAVEQTDGTGGTAADIVVTATKRNENLIDVPITVSVFTEESIAAAGIDRPADFLSTIPNVTFIEDNAGEAYINIRGQTSVRNSDPNVAVVIDGATLTSLKAFNQDLFGLQQIEVLKGPQSALYGRNAAAGAIVITTKRPTDEFEGNVTLGYGNFDTKRATASLAGPISDSLKFIVSGSFRDTDGPFTNITTGEKVQRFRTGLGRARFLWEPVDRLEVDLRLSGYSSTGGGTAYNAQLVGLPIGPFPGTALDANNADMPFISNIRGSFSEWLADALLKVDYDLDFATLTSITNYNKLRSFFGGDSPPYVPDTGLPSGLTQGYLTKDRNFSQEVRLTSPGSQAFRWQVGAYYLSFRRLLTSELNIDALGFLPPSRGVIDDAGTPQPTVSFGQQRYTTKSFAPFASIQYDITDSLHLNLAGRYDIEKRTVAEIAPDAINPVTGANYNLCIALTGRGLADCHDERTFKQFEPKASLTYEISNAATVYASYGKGFKSGGFNPIGARQALIDAAASVGLPPSSVYVQDRFDKEVSTSYELGAKLRLFNRRLAINGAVFKTDIKGAQQFEFYPTVGLQTTVGIDEVALKGFDVDFDAQLPFGLRLFGGYGYTDGEVKRFEGNPAFNGNVAPGSFKTTLTLGATQEFDLGGDLQLIPRIEYSRYGSVWWDVANTPGTRRDPLDLLSGRLTLKSGDRWDISLWGNNLTNEKYFQEVVPLLGVFTVNYRGPTRSYGLEARLNF